MKSKTANKSTQPTKPASVDKATLDKVNVVKGKPVPESEPINMKVDATKQEIDLGLAEEPRGEHQRSELELQSGYGFGKDTTLDDSKSANYKDRQKFLKAQEHDVAEIKKKQDQQAKVDAQNQAKAQAQ